MDDQPSNPELPQIPNHNNGTLSMLLESKTLVATTIALIIAIILLIVVNSNIHTSSKAKTSTASESQTTTTPVNTQNQVAIWQTNYGSQLTTLQSDISATNAQVSDQTYSGLETACQQLGTDVATDQSTPGIPNSTAADDYSNGLSQLATAASSCVAGSQIYLNPADNSQPKIELQAGADLATFSADLKSGTTDIQNTITAIDSAVN
jgi:competence protein ComGC